jgi:hypothetical protein
MCLGSREERLVIAKRGGIGNESVKYFIAPIRVVAIVLPSSARFDQHTRVLYLIGRRAL